LAERVGRNKISGAHCAARGEALTAAAADRFRSAAAQCGAYCSYVASCVDVRHFDLKRTVFLAFVLGAVTSILVIVAVFAFHFVNPYCCSRFDAREWKMAGEGSDWEVSKKQMDCIRGGMITDPRIWHLTPNMRKEELFSLLGPPVQSLNDRAKGCFSYVIGYCRGLGIDLNSITFCFDADGRLLNGSGEVRG
jgi:hypothetical protein